MANDELLTDDYVAGILARDAKESATKYSALGLEAFSSTSKPPASKPKPNTRFLRNIIKDTDSHNAALLAKEAADSRARLHSLGGHVHRDEKASHVGGGDIRRRQLGDIAAILGGRPSKRRNTKTRTRDSDGRQANTSGEDEQSELKGDEEKRRKHRSRDGDKEDRISKHRQHGADGKEDDDRTRDHKSHRRRHRSRSEGRDEDDRKRRKRDVSFDRERGKERRRRRSRSPTDRESKRPRYRSRSPKGKLSESPELQMSRPSRKDPKPEPKPEYDSDPLDDIIGPRPPSIPEVRSRGRGTISQASGIDSRFSTTYDPTVDVQLDPDEENDWDQALEALRDRQKWKQQGADRLRAAGFTDEEIGKWEKGGEKRAEDVKWAKKGEGREWDRGKVVGADGVFSSSASWGRLDGATSDGDDIAESSWGRLKGT
ncbi:hypothetical protein D0Z07_3284 [Hyphodiscus hymeniophilus]|uniref:Uncharacterized protein n=1 Tax=Hyphodiscus hymeniophilus TaxID=353542 RepID=A0A9P6VM12_9HELO|nr:hypothetical protein D0Z07_3284 [Hyphodiscus hymeniophilus]